MAASPVSVAADSTPTSRRRNLLTAQKKSGVDLAGSDTVAASPITGGGDDYSSLKLRSRSIRIGPETGLDKSIDAAKIKSRTTAKKATGSSSTKPLWKTVISVFTKNFVLLLVLALLAQMCRRLVLNQADGNDALVTDYERRIAEAESFLKTTTKMIQARVDSVDQKIQSEISGLKTELSNRINDNEVEFSSRMQGLDTRVVNMEKSLSSSTEWLSKDEFDRFMEGFKVHKGIDNHGDLKLDEIRAFAKEIIETEIGKHAADGLGRVDYAAATGGATVVEHSDSISGENKWLNRKKVSDDAVKMLQPSFGEPGQCFALKGNNGFVEIKLRTAIIPEAITLEHVAKSVAFDMTSAPKNCLVFGWLRNQATEQRHLLTEFVYDLEKSSAQTFNVLDIGDSTIIDTIRLEFTSNHGNPSLTCIYRLRMHGQEPDSLSSIAL